MRIQKLIDKEKMQGVIEIKKKAKMDCSPSWLNKCVLALYRDLKNIKRTDFIQTVVWSSNI